MTERAVPAAVLTELERSTSPDALIWFLVITHPSLKDPIRIVSDVFDYKIGADIFTGILFNGKPVTDTNQAPSAELRVQNIDRAIGKALEQASDRAKVEAFVHSTAEFDLTLDPREVLSGPTKIYHYQQFEMTDVEVNALEIVARVSLSDNSVEPFPFIRATSDRFRGLFV